MSTRGFLTLFTLFSGGGEPLEQIIEMAGEVGASLAVMGIRDRKRLSRLLMDSVTDRTIGYAGAVSDYPLVLLFLERHSRHQG